MTLLGDIDRRAGARVRAAVAGRRGGGPAARALAGGVSPAFRALVLVLLLTRGRRRAGAEALAAGALASLAALALRERLGRRRPGPRLDGGFPSRHAAAATAIACVVGRDRPAAASALAVAAALGLSARVATGEHEPADIVCGGALGWAVAHVVGAFAGRVEGPAGGRLP